MNVLKSFPDDSIDLVCTDPPYGTRFMNEKWDKDVPINHIFEEIYRVLKPGSFLLCMSAPRMDAMGKMISRIYDAGFKTEFAPLYWVYTSGFTKRSHLAIQIDNYLCDQWFREKYGKSVNDIKKRFIEYAFKFKKTDKKKFDKIDTCKLIWSKLIKAKWAKEEYSKDINYVKENPLLRHDRTYITIPSIFSQDRKNDIVKKRNSPFPKSHLPNDPSCGKLIIQEQVSKTGAHSKNTRQNPFHDGTNLINVDHPTGKKRVLLRAEPISPEAIEAFGKYAGCQLAPAVEVILIAMKPIKGSYRDHYMKYGNAHTNQKECKIPYAEWEIKKILSSIGKPYSKSNSGIYGFNDDQKDKIKKHKVEGRLTHKRSFGGNTLMGFNQITIDDVNYDLKRDPSNLLVSDNALYGLTHFFDLDAWYNARIKCLPKEVMERLPFLYVPKPGIKEKNKGLQKLIPEVVNDGRKARVDNPFQRGETLRKNTHKTVKPIKLMQYLITMFSDRNDIVLDPFMGSGTTCIAAKYEDRNYIGIELEEKSFKLSEKRIGNIPKQKKIEKFFQS